ncbi:hypothetical protein CTE07_48280 [Chitinophaga terrae (ex Kim and Jung 2007)]|nr:hypothetical protein CTE07_48280 [Chitinophaga terrae (ex Kim and Jung 2007)]
MLAPPPDTIRGLIGYYYQDNGGNPFTTLVKGGVYDTSFCFNWQGGNPGYGLTDDNFSVRWIALLRAPVTGTYTFNTNADDGIKFIIKDFKNRRADAGRVIVDNGGGCCRDVSGTVDLEAGKLYPIEVEFFEKGGGANIMYFTWTAPNLPKQQVYSQYFYAMQPPEAARPKISPDRGLFEGSVNIVLSSTTPGAEIHYTLDGTTPTINSPVYDPLNPVKLTAANEPVTYTIKASAYKEDMFVSEVTTGAVTVMPPALPNPVFTPSAGVYQGRVKIKLSVGVPGSSVYYTTDGSTPTTSSNLYTSEILIDSTTRIKAYAVKDGRSPSQVVAGTYTIVPDGAAVPVFSLPEGAYTGTQTVSISSSTPGAVIHYALNDEVLSSASPVYTTPLEIKTTTTVKAYATAAGLSDSKPAIATYTIGTDDPVSTPEFSIPPGTYNSIRQVGIYTNTKGATIHYTLDGTIPDENSPVYYALIPVTDSAKINAIAMKPGMKNSAVATGVYYVTAEARDTSLINTNLPAPKLTISPNPASGMARISWSGVITTKDGFRVVITDSRGAVVNTTLVQGGYTYYQFNTSTLAEGVYFVKVQSGNSIAKGKMIVAR